MIIPLAQRKMNRANSFGLIAFLSMIIEGRLRVVTAIMKDKTVPNCAPFEKSASATGIAPKISAYIGIPINVMISTPKGLFSPRARKIQFSGIQL